MSRNSVAGPPPAPLVDTSDPQVQAAVDRHWRSNVRLMAWLLAVWATVGLGCGVLFADWLNQYSVHGFPLGFWFAQQGSIVVFVVLILVYAVAMTRLDRRHRAVLIALRERQLANRAAADPGA